ncbi:MAG: tetratricopeptide repeat protein [Fusobacterium sp.]|uniref:tetratricopeptide repeat protein n=1 Tax=Fusobacterium sp. TaxID=68766 RepID=UPI003FA0F996
MNKIILYKEKYNKTPNKYGITYKINEILLKGQKFKRLGEYKKAQDIYDGILQIDGASGILYIAIAKNLACNGEYEGAIKLLELANKACINELGIEDENCLYHIEQLRNREKLGNEAFLKYMRSIAGNPNYELSKD